MTHERAVTKELFLEVNGLLSKNHYGYSLKPENDEAPMKRFVRCAACDKPLTAYKARKNQQYYYKSNSAGCTCNRRATDMHEKFKALIAPYQIEMNADLRTLIGQQMEISYHRINADRAASENELQQQIAVLQKKIERLEERHAFEEITAEVFSKYTEKLLAEKKELEFEFAKTGNKLSNPKKCIEQCTEIASKLAPLWDLGDYGERQPL